VSGFSIRSARAGDEEIVFALLHELADYEKLLDRFHITQDVITRDYLGERRPINCELAFEGDQAVGIATWTWTYASFAAARGIYLEDLFVRPAFRGRGYGKALLTHLAKVAVAANAVRVDWQVLDWNKPSIDFYESLGARPVTGWLTYRLDGEALKKAAKMISLILARADNGVIGANGALPWRLPEDMRRFKAITTGKPCIMGRKTWDSLPKKPLPDRTNIVVARSALAAQGAIVAHLLDEALAIARKENAEIMVIGGAQIYAAALPQAGRVYLTEIHAAPCGDTHFPAFDPGQWRETARQDGVTPQGLRYSFVTLDRNLP